MRRALSYVFFGIALLGFLGVIVTFLTAGYLEVSEEMTDRTYYLARKYIFLSMCPFVGGLIGLLLTNIRTIFE